MLKLVCSSSETLAYKTAKKDDRHEQTSGLSKLKEKNEKEVTTVSGVEVTESMSPEILFAAVGNNLTKERAMPQDLKIEPQHRPYDDEGLKKILLWNDVSYSKKKKKKMYILPV